MSRYPKLIIEVGSWKGESAHYMINRATKYEDSSIICVDTWLGSSEHWILPHCRSMLNIRAGRPTLHEQFMANVVHAGLQERVVPIPLPSHVASILLKSFVYGEFYVSAGLVYIDGAHDETSVREDINAYWPLVSSAGLMVGDDYSPEWPGVVKAADEFRREYASEIQSEGVVGSRWFAQKKVSVGRPEIVVAG